MQALSFIKIGTRNSKVNRGGYTHKLKQESDFISLLFQNKVRSLKIRDKM
jgi:hypothetical protein